MLARIDKEDNIGQAIGYFEQAIDIDPSCVQAYNKLSESYWQYYKITHQIDYATKAEGLSKRALTINPDSIYAYLALGEINTGLGKYGTALAAYQLSIKNDPPNFEVFRGLATLYEKMGDLEKAETYLKKAILQKPLYWDAYNEHFLSLTTTKEVLMATDNSNPNPLPQFYYMVFIHADIVNGRPIWTVEPNDDPGLRIYRETSTR